MRWTALLLLCCLLPAAGQTPPVARKPAAKKTAPATRKPVPAEEAKPRFLIDVIEVTGNRLFTKEQVLRVAQLKVGDPGGKEVFDAARDRLLASGAFESAGYRYSPSPRGGYQITFELVEVEQAYPVRFDGLGEDTTELRQYLQEHEPLFGERIPGTDKLLRQMASTVEKYLAGKGVTEKIVGRVISDTPDTLIVVFRPARQLPTVAEVRFRGNQAIPTTALQNRIATVAVGTVYTEKNFRQILEANIRPMYEARGRIRVTFPQVETEPAKDVKGLVVTVTVEEGEVYTLSKVEVFGEGLERDDLLRAGQFAVDSIANFDEIAEGVERMKRRMQREGFLDVSAKVERRVNDEQRTVDLTIIMEPGDQYRMGELKIIGLDLLAEAAVRKLWALQPGKPFNASYPDFFLRQIRERAVFQDLGKTTAAVEPDPETKTVNVTLTFEYAPPPKPRRF